MTQEQPEALIAEYRPSMPHEVLHDWANDAVAELRRLHALVGELSEKLMVAGTDLAGLHAENAELRHGAAVAATTIQALRKNDERYRWLREEASKPSAKITVGIWGEEGNSHCDRIGSSSDDVDTAIDAAMKGQS